MACSFEMRFNISFSWQTSIFRDVRSIPMPTTFSTLPLKLACVNGDQSPVLGFRHRAISRKGRATKTPRLPSQSRGGRGFEPPRSRPPRSGGDNPAEAVQRIKNNSFQLKENPFSGPLAQFWLPPPCINLSSLQWVGGSLLSTWWTTGLSVLILAKTAATSSSVMPP
jgi:hypothetical protein